MAVFCNFGQPDFVRWLMSDGFVRQSKRALTVPLHTLNYKLLFHELRNPSHSKSDIYGGMCAWLEMTAPKCPCMESDDGSFQCRHSRQIVSWLASTIVNSSMTNLNEVHCMGNKCPSVCHTVFVIPPITKAITQLLRTSFFFQGAARF